MAGKLIQKNKCIIVTTAHLTNLDEDEIDIEGVVCIKEQKKIV